jgi:hypothetical protein
MQEPPVTPTTEDDDEASIPAEHVRDDPNTNPNQYRTVTVRRQAAKRTFPWDLAADEIQLALPRPQDEDEYIHEAKRRRRLEEEPVPTSTDEAITENTSHDTVVALPPPHAATDSDREDPVADMHPNVRTAGASRRRWTPEEDVKLTSAATSTPKKKRGKEYKHDWVAISAQVPGRTQNQCYHRWHDGLDPSVDRVTGNTGTWKDDEDIQLKAAVRTIGVKDWAAITAAVPNRTQKQCQNRWYRILDPSINQMTGRTGKWKEDEDIKLKAAVRTHGGKDWATFAAQVPGRTRAQCHDRWRHALDPSIALTAERKGTWEEDEDIKLKGAVRTHGGKDWRAIAAVVPGRTKYLCYNRWRVVLDPSIKQMAGRRGKWTADEDIKLKGAVRTIDGKDWAAIAALVPGRTKRQCVCRWRENLDPHRITGREEEHDTLNKTSA